MAVPSIIDLGLLDCFHIWSYLWPCGAAATILYLYSIISINFFDIVKWIVLKFIYFELIKGMIFDISCFHPIPNSPGVSLSFKFWCHFYEIYLSFSKLSFSRIVQVVGLAILMSKSEKTKAYSIQIHLYEVLSC